MIIFAGKPYSWKGIRIKPGPACSKPWARWRNKPGPLSSKTGNTSRKAKRRKTTEGRSVGEKSSAIVSAENVETPAGTNNVSGPVINGTLASAEDKPDSFKDTGDITGQSISNVPPNVPVESIADEDVLTSLSKDDLMNILQSKNCMCSCGHIIPDKVLCSIHRSVHSVSNPLRCAHCNVVFDTYYKFQEHLHH